MDPLLLLDGIEDHQYFLAVFVHIFLQHFSFVIKRKILLVLQTQLCYFLLSIITVYVLLKIADLVVKIEELPVGG